MIWILGVDEAGRGAWAGPVVAASIFWKGRCPIKGILKDSKKMSLIERTKTYEEIVKLSTQGKLFYGVGIIPNTVIDSCGIREANRLAMQSALREIQSTKYKVQDAGIRLMIDGRDNYQFDIPDLPKPEYIVRGDSKIKQIMAASILAKVSRDNLMRDFETEFPGYGFAQHKGYGTQFHQQAFQKLGVCDIHRKSYRPLRNYSIGLISKKPFMQSGRLR